MKLQSSVQTGGRWAGFFRSLLQRMRAMAGGWALLGAVMGLNCEALPQGDGIALVANILAWMIVMSVMGTLLSLFGGRPVDSWLGAGLGFIITGATVLLSSADQASLHMQLNFGALLGALVAATGWPWVRMSIAVTRRVRSMLASAS